MYFPVWLQRAEAKDRSKPPKDQNLWGKIKFEKPHIIISDFTSVVYTNLLQFHIINKKYR